MIDLVQARLKIAPATSGLFKAVQGLSELAALTGPPVVKPSAFVIPLSEQPDDNTAIGEYRQRIVSTIGVMIFCQSLGDPAGGQAIKDLVALRVAVKAALFGWAPAGWSPLALAGGELIDAAGGVIQWQDNFTGWQDQFAQFQGV